MAVKEKNLERRSFIRMAVVGGLFLLAIVFSFVGLTRNSQGATDRYNALIAVDQAGGDVQTSLNELQAYVHAHMNTQIGGENGIKPPIQLAGTFQRLVDAEQARVDTVNQSLSADAQKFCEENGPAGFSGSNRLACIEDYIDENGTQPTVIDDSLYKFDFAPPTWSPDFAGFSVLAAIILGAVFFVDVILYFRTRHLVHLAQ